LEVEYGHILRAPTFPGWNFDGMVHARTLEVSESSAIGEKKLEEIRHYYDDDEEDAQACEILVDANGRNIPESCGGSLFGSR
jgi:hypothetical protein